MKQISKVLIQIGITLIALFVLICFVDAAYSAIFVGNQLAHASIASVGITLIGYAIPVIISIVAIVYTWTWKNKK